MSVAAVGVEDSAYQTLRRAIVDGELHPGTRLVEADLVGRLGASRPVVRSALSRLRYEGLVEREPNRGASVRTVTVEEAVEIVQARAVLEGLAARRAAERADARDVAELREILADMAERIATGDLVGYSEGNARFHARLLEASGHRTVQRLVTGLRAQVVRFQFRTILVAGRPRQSLREHERILRAVEDHDADAAAAAMETHLLHVVENLPRTDPARARLVES